LSLNLELEHRTLDLLDCRYSFGIKVVTPAKSQRTSINKSVRRNVASKVHLNDKVTPRSIAYAAVQVGFFLLHVILCLYMATSSISTCKLQIHGPQFMEDLTTRDYIIMSLMSLMIPQGLLQRSAPKIYLTGGQREYSFVC
jgi:hypothetical protein